MPENNDSRPSLVERTVYWCGVIMSLFHLWVNTFGVMPEIRRNAFHFAFILFAGYLLYPFRKGKKPGPLSYLLAVLSAVAGAYLLLFEDALHLRNEIPILSDLIFAAIAVFLTLEIARRTAGYIIPLIALTFMTYALWWGRYMGGLLNFPGVTVERMLYRMYFAPDGLFGSIATISSTFVFLFVLFAAFLVKSGAGEFIIRLAGAVMGKTIGGPAKIAILASGLMGSISGSAVANTVSTGSITIPLMKKTGFSAKFSGAVEAAASTGGQIMPPIMGAGAFIMAQWTQISYLKIVAAAFLPAALYFASLSFFVHLRAKKEGIKPLSSEDIEPLSKVLKEGWNFFIPIAVLVGMLIYGYSPVFSACVGIIFVIVSSWLNPKTAMGFKDVLDALALGARNMVPTGVILICSGIVVGVVLMAGAGIKFSILIFGISGGSLLITIVLTALASLILGMGLPVTASYIVLAVLAAPSMQMLGASTLAAHMLVFWYSQHANVTPPVCLAAYTAAGISGGPPLATGIEAWKLAKGLYIIPLLFIYSPLLSEGSLWPTIETAASAAAGLFCFAVVFEGFHLVRLGALFRLAYLCAAFMLLWPATILHACGGLLLLVLVISQKTIAKPSEPRRVGTSGSI